MNSEELTRTATLRWFVDVSAWHPVATEFDWLLSVLPEAEDRAAVLRFRFEEDRKRALCSRLMQRACVRAVCCSSSRGGHDPVADGDAAAAEKEEMEEEEVLIVRATKGKKPFTTNAKPSHAPNFNFNVGAVFTQPPCKTLDASPTCRHVFI